MKNRIRSIIIDDEPHAIEMLMDSLQMVSGQIDVVQTYTSWGTAMEGLRNHPCDLLFLDISMQGRNSLEMLKCLPELQAEIIFVTAHSDFAIPAFNYQTSGYILKPVDDAELAQAITRAANRIRQKTSPSAAGGTGLHQKIGIPDNKTINYIEVGDILYLEGFNTYTKVVSRRKEIVSSYNLARFKEILPQDYFIQVHRSYLINLNCISRYDTSGVLYMDNEAEVPVSRSCREHLLNLFVRVRGKS